MELQIVFAVLIIGMLLYETFEYMSGRASHSWVTVDATVNSIFSEHRTDENEEESRPKIQFTYMYLGKRYTSKRYGFGDFWNRNYGKTISEMSGLISGKEITVYVNPKNPRQATYVQGYHGYFYIQFFCLIILAGLCATKI